MPVVIYGTAPVTSTLESGQFQCPGCGRAAHYDHKRVRRFFTLYWIPLFPVGTLGTYIECSDCMSTWDEAVLAYNPEAEKQAFMSTLDLALRRLMALMVLADGEVDDNEVTTMAALSENLPMTAMDEAQVRAELDEAQQDSRTVADYCETVTGQLNVKGKQLMVRAAMMIAASDGDFADEERELVASIAKALSLSDDEFTEALAADA